MTDIFSSSERSSIMSRIKSKGNATTELAMASAFRRLGVKGWLRHRRIGKYSPDFVFCRENVALFLDGCFWHHCPVHGSIPKSNREFWIRKLRRNQERDRRVEAHLNVSGWICIRLWEHSVKRNPDACAAEVLDFLEFVRNIRVI